MMNPDRTPDCALLAKAASSVLNGFIMCQSIIGGRNVGTIIVPATNARTAEQSAKTDPDFANGVAPKTGIEPVTYRLGGGKSAHLSTLRRIMELSTKCAKPISCRTLPDTVTLI
jgi:hypothetical protein